MAHYPELRARVAVTAEMLGSDTTWVNAQCDAMCQLAALHVVWLAVVIGEQLAIGGAQLCEPDLRGPSQEISRRGLGEGRGGIVATFVSEWVAYFVSESWRPLQRNIQKLL